MIDKGALLALLPVEPVSADSFALSLGLTAADVVPPLNSARDEGLAIRVSIGEEGHVGWRLP